MSLLLDEGGRGRGSSPPVEMTNEAVENKADEADATDEAVGSGVAIDTNAVNDANKAKAYANMADSIEVAHRILCVVVVGRQLYIVVLASG